MKKFYLGVVCLIFVASGFSQSFYWVGGASGNWNTSANWSATSGGTGGLIGLPGSTSNVIFNTATSVNVDVVSVDINSLTITNSQKVKLTSATGDLNFQVNSTNSGAPALKIDAGSRLEDSANTGTTFAFVFGDDSKGVVNGTWYFTGASEDYIAYFLMPFTTGQSTRLDVNGGGAITITNNSFIADNDEYLHFNANSSLNLMRSVGGTIPMADYDDASTIFLSGITTTGFAINETVSIGNLTYNCPTQSDIMLLSLLSIRVGGNLRILSTGGENLTLLANGDGVQTPLDLQIDGNLEVQGNSVVIASAVASSGQQVNITVGGSLILNGTSFNLQANSVNLPTTLLIGGNFQHTAGTFVTGSSSTSSTATSRFVVGFNGSSAQTISSVTGSIDNAVNGTPTNQVALKISNTSGGVSLLTPLSVGRLQLTAGKLTTTSTNVLTVNNSSATIALSASGGSYVSGPLRRKTASTGNYLFPTGTGSAAGGVTIIPSGTAATTFEAAGFNAAYSDLSVVAPISGVADNQYYEVKRIAGTADATIQLALSSAINGANPSDALVAASYDGSDWVNAKGATGTTLIPGNSTSGTVRSDIITSFGSPSRFTFGYGLAAVLPINLVTFNAKKVEGNNAEISWKVTDNSTPVRFEVMKSGNGVTFAPIGTVQAAEGKLNYALTDKELAPGNNYYRLRMYDKDGSITYSNIVVVMNGTKGVLISSMMPTVVTDRARLNVSSSTSGKIELVITDISGRIVQQQTAEITNGNQQVWLNANRLAAGMYQVTGYMSGEKTKTFRFIKQ